MASLFFKYGVMNASKSAQLIMNQHNYETQRRKTLVLKPTLDVRDSGVVKSRALNDTLDALMLPTYFDATLEEYILQESPDVIFVDEVQFLDPYYIDLFAQMVDNYNIPVLCYGLMADFKTELFPASKRLIELGAKLEEIKTVCTVCDKKATINMRLNNGEPVFDGDSIQVGGNESYRVVCRSCYYKIKNDSLFLMDEDDKKKLL